MQEVFKKMVVHGQLGEGGSCRREKGGEPLPGAQSDPDLLDLFNQWRSGLGLSVQLFKNSGSIIRNRLKPGGKLGNRTLHKPVDYFL